MQEEIIINWPTFFAVTMINALIGVSIYLMRMKTKLPLIGINRVTFTTRHGQQIFDLGTSKKMGFTLDQSQIEMAEDVFLSKCQDYGFTVKEVQKFFSNNKIYYKPFPVAVWDSSQRKTVYHEANYRNDVLNLGIQPWVDKTALFYEWIHDILREKFGDPDSDHKLMVQHKGEGEPVSIWNLSAECVTVLREKRKD